MNIIRETSGVKSRVRFTLQQIKCAGFAHLLWPD